MNPLIQSKTTTLSLVITFVLSCFALAATAQAVSPPPDGGYAGFNTAEGDNALQSLTTGLTTGVQNTAVGGSALQNLTTGSQNTAIGNFALFHDIDGGGNTAIGLGALYNDTTGKANTASGGDALYANTTGVGNTANGTFALYAGNGSENTASGDSALVLCGGNNNIALGAFAGKNLRTGDNNIDIGNEGVTAEANTIRIGTVGTQTDVYIGGIYQTTVAKGVGVVIDSAGHLGTKGSSERFKDAIKPMDKASEAILALKPVTFHYKKELDPEGIPHFGLVAEEVEKVNPDLVARDADGKVYTVRYEAVNAMLLNEFLKEHRKVEQLKSTVAKQEAIIARQQKGMEALAAHLKEQDSKIQKVTDQLEVNKPAPQMVLNNH
jgi:Chaperone of endosialidase